MTAHSRQSRWKSLTGLGALLSLALSAVLAAALAAGCAGNGDRSRFAGTWDLQQGESPDGNENLSEANVSSMRELGLDAYLNLEDDGTLTLVTFDEAKRGDWKVTGQDTANATVEGQSAVIALEGDLLELRQQGTTLTFARSGPKAPPSGPGEAKGDGGSEEGAGLSETVVRGALLDKPVMVADDELCTVVVDGVGTDRWGDPGYNLQITNNQDTPMDLWVLDPFRVGTATVSVYLCETVAPHQTITAFMQFDTADLHSTSPASLQDVEGVLLVDDAQDVTIGRYPFKM